MFYRESLARILALEKFRNLIETNIEAGITLYTDHKPALFENSLSNKGQLSAWKLAEVADLLSIVENCQDVTTTIVHVPVYLLVFTTSTTIILYRI